MARKPLRPARVPRRTARRTGQHDHEGSAGPWRLPTHTAWIPRDRLVSRAAAVRAVLALIVLALSAFYVLTKPPRLGLDLRGGTQIVLETRDSPTVKAGQVFIPMHYAETNRLTHADFDPYSRQPSYKNGAVEVRRSGRLGRVARSERRKQIVGRK